MKLQIVLHLEYITVVGFGGVVAWRRWWREGQGNMIRGVRGAVMIDMNNGGSTGLVQYAVSRGLATFPSVMKIGQGRVNPQ